MQGQERNMLVAMWRSACTETGDIYETGGYATCKKNICCMQKGDLLRVARHVATASMRLCNPLEFSLLSQKRQPIRQRRESLSTIDHCRFSVGCDEIGGTGFRDVAVGYKQRDASFSRHLFFVSPRWAKDRPGLARRRGRLFIQGLVLNVALGFADAFAHIGVGLDVFHTIVIHDT